MNIKPHPTSDQIQFELAAGAVIIDQNQLEKIKLAMLLFFDKPESEFPAQHLEVRDALRAELSSSAVWISDNIAHVGAWTLQHQAGRLALVRYPPPRNNTMYIFHAMLEPKDPGWEVVAFEVEREFGPD